jgi:hypothetical protein
MTNNPPKFYNKDGGHDARRRPQARRSVKARISATAKKTKKSPYILFYSGVSQSVLDGFFTEFSYNTVCEFESGINRNELLKMLPQARSFVVLLREEFDRDLMKKELESHEEVGASEDFYFIDL